MTVTLKVRNGIYHLIISYKDETGKWKQKSETTGLRSPGNKRAAEAMRKKREAELSTMSPAQLEAQNNLFLDEMEDWYIAEILLSGEENGIAYEMLLYKRK